MLQCVGGCSGPWLLPVCTAGVVFASKKYLQSPFGLVHSSLHWPTSLLRVLSPAP
jgi:hypothetical protein